jgi:hypothetical protein
MRQIEFMCTDKFSAYNWRALDSPVLLSRSRGCHTASYACSLFLTEQFILPALTLSLWRR